VVVVAGAAIPPASAASTSVVISTAQQRNVGKILVSGTTVYTLKPSKTACTAKCLAIWPPVMLPAGVSVATAGAGVDASKLGTLTTSGGQQVTYSGKALYWYYKDKVAGQVRGNLTDKWGKWSTVVTAKAGHSSTGGSGGTNNGGGSGGTNAGTGGVSF
jgi:predicted lipoprotein with Yx(FWY)xxD motif